MGNLCKERPQVLRDPEIWFYDFDFKGSGHGIYSSHIIYKYLDIVSFLICHCIVPEQKSIKSHYSFPQNENGQ
jgi:hypothetical protein